MTAGSWARVYLPGTVELLRGWIAAGEVVPFGGTGFAVTASLRVEYGVLDDAGGDEEELEYLALRDAARGSLRLLADADADAAPIRVVVAADAPDGAVTERGDLDRAAVKIAGMMPWRQVAAVYVDGADAADVVRQAVRVVVAADLGDPDAEFTLGSAEDIDLAWYSPDEVAYLVVQLTEG